MDPVVTARVPAGIRSRGIEVLHEIGSTTSELVNAAFEYVIQERQLPHAKLPKTDQPAIRALSMSLERINVCSTGHSDVKSALDAGWDDAEDALIAHSCKSVAADYLLTRDEKQAGFQQLDIPALTPEEF